MPYKKYSNGRNSNRKQTKKGFIYKINENLIIRWSILLIVFSFFALNSMNRGEVVNTFNCGKSVSEFGLLILDIFKTFIAVFTPLLLLKYYKVVKKKISINSLGKKAIMKRIGVSMLFALIISTATNIASSEFIKYEFAKHFELWFVLSIYILISISALTGFWKGFSFIFDADRQKRRYNNNRNYNNNRKNYNNNGNKNYNNRTNSNRTYSNK